MHFWGATLQRSLSCEELTENIPIIFGPKAVLWRARALWSITLFSIDASPFWSGPPSASALLREDFICILRDPIGHEVPFYSVCVPKDFGNDINVHWQTKRIYLTLIQYVGEVGDRADRKTRSVMQCTGVFVLQFRNHEKRSFIVSFNNIMTTIIYVQKFTNWILKFENLYFVYPPPPETAGIVKDGQGCRAKSPAQLSHPRK